jgi:hypothetical protein
MDPVVTPILSLLSAILGGTLVAIVNHHLTNRRERFRSKREFNLKYLIDAWRNISKGSRRGTELREKASALETGIADIQLFGNATQISLAQRLADDVVKTNITKPGELLIDLRDSIRRELDLEAITNDYIFFEIEVTPKDSTSAGSSER